MKIAFYYTNSINGGYGVLGKGIQSALEAGGYLDYKNPDVLLCYGVPHTILDAKKDYPNKPVVYYGVWESSIYNPEWADMIKKLKVDLLLTATEFTKQTMEDHGLTAYVWHHGLDSRWKYKNRRDDGVFTFLHYNAYEWRKGWDLVVKAFTDEFEDDEPVKLIMKARERRDGFYVTNPTTKKLDNPMIEELIGHISDEAMVEMLDSADCGVFPVRGEGWFLPATECIASGIPVIFPNQMAMAEQWGDGYIDVEIEGYINASPRYAGWMIQPSLQDLRKKMRWAYENELLIRELAKKGSKQVKAKYNWKKVTNELIELIKMI